MQIFLWLERSNGNLVGLLNQEELVTYRADEFRVVAGGEPPGGRRKKGPGRSPAGLGDVTCSREANVHVGGGSPNSVQKRPEAPYVCFWQGSPDPVAELLAGGE
ncbi:hypothetical protein MA16_Dca009246 [Dendrobium catenatum]|uniref:Uncharacterized protein n=1 Tax=Dendrobium catenatum TaxID=906689 RepID=A0A2I0WYV4_9ASPA|nr:hypothetical protein MA16_Dca009246 [Dendrobium catenatum]